MDSITIDAAAVVQLLDAALLSCMELESLTESDSMTDVWYHAEHIKQDIAAIRTMIGAETARKG